ncbi:MAG: DUF3579 domain-containing protein [Thioalkalispiraceae bacterium]
MSNREPDEEILVIQGMRDNGDKLRPSDWIERISSTLASFGADHRLQYCRSVQPCIVGGEKCLVVARGLETSNPQAFDYIMQFARSNRLKTFTDRRNGKRALIV